MFCLIINGTRAREDVCIMISLRSYASVFLAVEGIATLSSVPCFTVLESPQGGVIFVGVRKLLGSILVGFSTNYFRGLGLGLGLEFGLLLQLRLGLVWCYGQGKFRVRVRIGLGFRLGL